MLNHFPLKTLTEKLQWLPGEAIEIEHAGLGQQVQTGNASRSLFTINAGHPGQPRRDIHPSQQHTQAPTSALSQLHDFRMTDIAPSGAIEGGGVESRAIELHQRSLASSDQSYMPLDSSKSLTTPSVSTVKRGYQDTR